MENGKKLKRAITLAGRGPAAGLHIGVLECLKNAGIEFDVWALSCIGAWVGVVYNQAEKGKEVEQTYDFFCNGVFRDDVSYQSFPINYVSAPDWIGNTDALMSFLLEPERYRNLLLPKKIIQSFAHTMSLLASKQRKWSEGDINRWIFNDVLAVNPFVRLWTSMIFKSNIDGLSRFYHSDSTFIKNIKVERLYEEGRPYIFHNAWNLSKQKLELFSNKRDTYKSISAASMCACSSRPFVDQPVEIEGDKYCEGSLVDTVNFKALLQDHPDLDEIWIIRIGDAQLYRKPENLHDALGNLCHQYEATLGESDVELFKYHLKQDDRWHGRIVEVQINSDVTPDENRTNFARARATGRRAAERTCKPYVASSKSDQAPLSDQIETSEGHIELRFEDDEDRRLLDLEDGLVADRTYRLFVDLGPASDPRRRDEGEPLRKPQEQVVELRVAVLAGCNAIRFHNHVGKLTWGPGDVTQPAEFVFDAERAGNAVFDIYIDRDCDLLFAAEVETEVVLPGRPWSRPDPIGWTSVTDVPGRRSRAFRRFARALATEPGKRALCIAVQAAPQPDEYFLTVLIRAAELPIRARFSHLELDGLLMNVRGMLDRLRKNPVMIDGGYDTSHSYTGRYEPAEVCYRSDGVRVSRERINETLDGFLRDMAITGAALRSRLFADAAAQEVLRTILENAPEGSIVQIWTEKNALHFAFPWAWIYDEPFDPTYRAPPKKEAFWGHRLIIEQVADWLEPPLRPRQTPLIESTKGIHIWAGVYNFEELPAHRSFLLGLCRLHPRYPGAKNIRIWDKDKPLEEALPECDADILYFFSHGHTAMPLGAAGAKVYDMAEALGAWLDSVPPEEESDAVTNARGRLRNALKELKVGGLAEQHHIRLQTGYLVLENLRSLMLCDGRAPLVVLNMCESAQVFPSLADGLVPVFLAKGAVGVIGTEMPMLTQFAELFGRMFLARFLQGQPVGRILLDLRRHFLAMRNPLGFAYTHFGDALVRIDPPVLNEAA